MITDNNDLISINNSMDKPQKQRGWVREEMVVLVAEYFRTRDLSVQETRDSVRFVSEVLRKRAMKYNGFVSDTFRNLNGIQMQMACIVKYDPEAQKRGSSSLSNGSKLMESIVQEYLDNPDGIKAEAYDVICQYTDDFKIK